MENDIEDENKLNKNFIKSFFKEYIEESRSSIEKKIQEIIFLINSIKDENESQISKSK